MRPGKQLPSSTDLTRAEPTEGSASARHDGLDNHADSSPCEASTSASGTAGDCSKPGRGSLKPSGREPQCAQASLRDEVLEALRGVLHEKTASAAARASAGRTILEYFGGESGSGGGKRGAELSIAELDAEIARLTKG